MDELCAGFDENGKVRMGDGLDAPAGAAAGFEEGGGYSPGGEVSGRGEASCAGSKDEDVGIGHAAMVREESRFREGGFSASAGFVSMTNRASHEVRSRK